MDSFLFHQHTIPKQERFANSPLVSIFIIDKGLLKAASVSIFQTEAKRKLFG
tara:strand:+ start:404 stop:559 length:156 start_codon:yes stop_codon:yes gene_type:complete